MTSSPFATRSHIDTRGVGVVYQLICTIPPWITAVALPFIVVLGLDTSAVLAGTRCFEGRLGAEFRIGS